jgi:hypothetical protein
MTRLVWLIIAVIFGMAGYDMLLRGILGWTGYLVLGIGIGVATSVVGSYAHDLLAGSRERY